MDLKIVKSYRENETIRHSFNKLAMEIFGIDFESWYQHGFWTERYNPYSVLLDGEIVANVSVNRMTMHTPEKEYHVMQLGTVMTYEQYRNRGYIRMLMEEIEKDYAGKADGFYLFGNDSVLQFYPKFGFEPAEEFQAVKAKTENSKAGKSESCEKLLTAEKVPMETQEDWNRFMQYIEKSVLNSCFEMVDNAQLAMFYLSSFMKDNVYYVAEEDVFAVAEMEDSSLLLTAVYADHVVDLKKVIAAFGREFQEVRLGFTPLTDDDFDMIPYKEDDCTLFLKGDCWNEYRQAKLRFPELSHA
ncbi:MAG: GNAT family N-acetyltransferase [Lachnospiraceae bacterium]|nr:GNAT family N-acetyltransferase [Lachnospiraceae bacterium]